MTETALSNYADQIQRVTYDLVHYYAICDRFITQQLDVTASQGYILLAVPELDTINMNDLSLKMRVANSTMTRMVDQLVQKGLVNRSADPQDRRIVLINLTDQGKEVQLKLKDTLQDFFCQVLCDLPAEQLIGILEGLETLNKSIREKLKSCCGTELI